MRFNLISDFHVEMNDPIPAYVAAMAQAGTKIPFYPWADQRTTNTLVVAGDTSNSPLNTILVLSEAREFFETVLFVPGNHEHYIGYKTGQTVSQNEDMLRSFAASTDNVYMLEPNKGFQLGDTLFLGATGWYDWRSHPMLSRDAQYYAWKSDSNDSKCIRYDSEAFPDKLAQRDAEALAKAVTEAQDNEMISEIVMVTHTAPHPRGVVPTSHPWAYLNGSYHNTAMERVWLADTKKKITTWVFGHTHFLLDFHAEGIHFRTNPRGYQGEKNRHPEFAGLIEVDTAKSSPSVFGEIE